MSTRSLIFVEPNVMGASLVMGVMRLRTMSVGRKVVDASNAMRSFFPSLTTNVCIVWRQNGDAMLSSSSNGRTWLYLSSLFIVLATRSWFSLKLLEFPRWIIRVLFVRGSSNVSSAGDPSMRILRMWLKSSALTWSFTAVRVRWTSRDAPVYSPPSHLTSFPGSRPK